MDTRTFLIAMITFLGCTTFTIVSVARMWFGRSRGAEPKQLTEIAERLARVEAAVDAIAIETERISEGQRFTTKLLSERPKVLAGGAES